MIAEQIDLEWSRFRAFGLWLPFCIGFGYSTFIIYQQITTGQRMFAPGSFKEFIIWCAPIAFGFVVIGLIPFLFRSGIAISVGPKGIFDRRISSDWIPWDAIRGIHECQMKRQKWFILQLDPVREPSLPLHENARVAARRPTQIGPKGYYMTGSSMKGGSKALTIAVRHFAPKQAGS